MRSQKELKMDKIIVAAQQLANELGIYHSRDLFRRVESQLVANPDNLEDFIYRVEDLLEELKELKGGFGVPTHNPDQLTLF